MIAAPRARVGLDIVPSISLSVCRAASRVAQVPAVAGPVLRGEADFAIGSRNVGEGGIGFEWSLARRVISKGATLLAAPLTRSTDPMSSSRARGVPPSSLSLSPARARAGAAGRGSRWLLFWFAAPGRLASLVSAFEKGAERRLLRARAVASFSLSREHVRSLFLSAFRSGFFCVTRARLDEGRAVCNPLGFKIALEIMVRCRCQTVVDVPITFRAPRTARP